MVCSVLPSSAFQKHQEYSSFTILLSLIINCNSMFSEFLFIISDISQKFIKIFIHYSFVNSFHANKGNGSSNFILICRKIESLLIFGSKMPFWNLDNSRIACARMYSFIWIISQNRYKKVEEIRKLWSEFISKSQNDKST